MWLTDKKTILVLAFSVLIGEFVYVSTVNFGQEPLWWYDVALHTLGGALMAMIFLNLTGQFKNWWSFASAFQLVLSTVSFVFLAGVLWEFYEFTTAYFLHSMVLTLPDTLSDLFFDGVGGLFVSLLHVFSARRK